MIIARTAPVVDRRMQLALAAAAVVLLSRMALSLAIVPPWQQPDEPIHVAVAEVWRSRITGEGTSDRGREAEIIDSMIRHDWWRHYQKPLPAGPQPIRFLSTGAVVSTIGLEPESPSYAPPYYATVGWLLSLAPRGTVERDLYAMRLVSMLFAAGTLWVAFLACRLALDELGVVAVTSLLAVHPQFAIASTTAGPDALVTLAGALVWWQTMRALRGTSQFRSLAVLWLVSICAAIVDRLGVALLPIALSVTVMVSATRLRPRSAVVLVVCTVVAIAISVGTIPAIRGQVEFSLRAASGPSALGDLDYIRQFVAFLFTSWWYSLGWVRYQAPEWWAIVTVLVTIAASVGVVRQFLRRDGAARETIIVAVVNLIALLAAVGVVFLRLRVGPQGRYFFPAIVPSLTLLWLGTEAWVPERFRTAASVALVGVVAVLDVLAWILVALSAYT